MPASRASFDDLFEGRHALNKIALERATLYGLPVVAGRKVAYGTIDPDLSRSLFIRRALVEGDWETRHAFFAANRDLLAEVVCEDDEHLLSLLNDKIRAIPEVTATETFVYLRLRKQTYTWGTR